MLQCAALHSARRIGSKLRQAAQAFIDRRKVFGCQVKQLLKAVWGNEYDTDTHYIRIYMRQLRRKIEPDPAQPKYLITEAGIGYRLLGGE